MMMMIIIIIIIIIIILIIKINNNTKKKHIQHQILIILTYIEREPLVCFVSVLKMIILLVSTQHDTKYRSCSIIVCSDFVGQWNYEYLKLFVFLMHNVNVQFPSMKSECVILNVVHCV